MLIQSFSGVRGIYGESLTNEVVKKYSVCYYSHLLKKFVKPKKSKNKSKSQKTKDSAKRPKIVIGIDTRPSSELLKNSIIEILGADIIDVGTAGTPAVEFAVRYFKADGGIIITASHNEPYWNGMKFLRSDGGILKDTDMKKIIELYKKNISNSVKNLTESLLGHDPKPSHVEVKKEELRLAYEKFAITFIKKDIPKIKKAGIKIIIDPNGGTGITAESILKKAGVDVIAVNMDYGIFNRKVEPNFESLYPLANLAREEGASLAAGFDCDADRLQIILPNDRIVDGNYLLALITNEMLKEGVKKVIITNDATSGIVREVSKKHSAELHEVEVGETNVIDAMKKYRAKIGGEGSSGGVIISPSRCRDGIVTLLLVIKIIAKHGADIQKIIDDYPRYYNLVTKIEFDIRDHDQIKSGLEDHYKKLGYKISKTGDLSGGLKIIIDEDSFVWFRASKTEGSMMRIIADSKDYSKTEKLLKDAKSIFCKLSK
jgi:phosphomannomutase